MARPVIHSEKHIPQFSLAAIAAGAAGGVELVKAVAVANKNLVKEVTEGSLVKAIYIDCWITSQADTGLGTVIAIVEKVGIDDPGAVFADMIALNDYNNKKHILHTHMGLTPTETNSNPMNVVGGWVKIPKGMQRFGLGDILHLRLASQTEGINFCGFSIFKEYS